MNIMFLLSPACQRPQTEASNSKGTAPTILVPPLLRELSSIHPDPDPERDH